MNFVWRRYYTIQKSENSGPWLSVPLKVDPALTVFTVTDLRPSTNYRFRIQATNDIGPSPFSRESPLVKTLQAGKDIFDLNISFKFIFSAPHFSIYTRTTQRQYRIRKKFSGDNQLMILTANFVSIWELP